MKALNEESYNWYMAFTALYTEKKVKSQLDERGIANFLALTNSKLVWRGKVINRNVPVIPRCIFVRLSLSEIEKLRDIPSLLLPANLSDWQLSEQQMENISLTLSGGNTSGIWSLFDKKSGS